MSEPRDLRAAALGIFRDVLEGCDARLAVLRAVEFDGTRLRVGDARFDLRVRPLKIYSVALGKAAAAMARALDERLGESLTRGVLSAPSFDFHLSRRWRVFDGGHPLPNESSMEAARAALRLLSEANDPSALVVFLVSGGGSAMLELPRDAHVTFDDLREANRVLVSCGASIAEVNAVRRALSAVKGGGLSALAPLASQVTLIVSDVASGREYDVASGPTLPPPSGACNVEEIVERYGLASKLPASVVRALGEARELSSRDSAHDVLRSHLVLLDNASACEAAAESARARGFAVEVASDVADQPVGEGAGRLVSRLVSLFGREGGEGQEGQAGEGLDKSCGACLISGGEFACPVRGGGVGGRNSETALRVAFEFEKVASVAGSSHAFSHAVALCAGTDGIDGNSPAAGALADDTTLARARAHGLDARKFLDDSDAYAFFERLGDALVTGATGTNVRDVRILLASKD